jgi:hypothetical protein
MQHIQLGLGMLLGLLIMMCAKKSASP